MISNRIFRVGLRHFSFKKMLLTWGILFLYFAPAILMYGEPLSYFYEFVKYIRCTVCIIFIGVSIHKTGGKINALKLRLALFFMSLLLSSIMGDLNIVSWINTTVSIFGIYCIVEYYAKKNISDLLYYGFLYFFVLLAINNLLMIIRPGDLITIRNQLGNQSFFFLTSKNTFAMFSFPLLLLAHLCYEVKAIKSSELIMSIIVAVFPIVVVHSITSIVCISLYELAVVLLSKKQEKVFNARFWIVMIIVLSFLQIAFTYIFNNKTIQYVIISLLKKDPTLSGRSMLFNSAHQLIWKHFLLGMGNGLDGYYYYTVAPGYDSGGIMWAHNTSLDLLTQGGILFYILFYVVMYGAFKKIFKEKKKIDRVSLIIVCMLAAYTIMGFTERFDFRYDLHFVFALASVSEIIKNISFSYSRNKIKSL